MFSHMACVAENKRENKQSSKNERGNKMRNKKRNRINEITTLLMPIVLTVGMVGYWLAFGY